ncbi:hypothetical protein [Pseudomonas sp. NA-150]|uniref:hypothetical protein n=1 Tax=Pseudomonas sp. NA-150 TaxID=3367525 RepID=UPI0037C54C08
MKTLKSYLTAAFLTLAGVAADAAASTKKLNCDNSVCFQLAPLADNNNASKLSQV